MTTNERESRRRRIVSRGSDRLALITGQIENLPSPSPSDSHPQDLQTPFSSHRVNEASGSDSAKHESNLNADQANEDIVGSSEVAPSHERETSAKAIRDPPPLKGSELRSSLHSSVEQNSSISTSTTQRCLVPQTQLFKSFPTTEIISAIAATEETRRKCSIAIAVMIILSHLGFPILSSKVIRGILCFRPLYLVLLTNITVVLSLLLDKKRDSRRVDIGTSQNSSTEQIGNLIEVLWLIYKAICAFSMDCSIYFVIIVCGLSFLHLFH